MSNISPNIEASWKEILTEEFSKPYFANLKEFLVEEKKKHKIFPPGSQIFEAFNRTPFHKVKVVILGQDPYHGPGQAHGLCFSVQRGIKQPPSLKNIFKEIKSDLNIDPPEHGNLESWADQGILLINATLTVRAHEAGSHQKKGWEIFTDTVIRKLSEQREGIVFLLWGRYAQDKQKLIDNNKHHILKAAHPSPLSAHNGFWGCCHFSKTNQLLKSQGLTKIDWSIKD
ncbi:MAG: uracil-DNA glycosylase [Marinilabiliales bacterium]|nr:MAG: uracil-DNA glycosylase [Marinilabiliales bacterium]